MKVLRRRIQKTFERHNKLVDAAMRPLSYDEKNAFLDAYYNLPGVMNYIERKTDEYDEASGEPFDKFLDRHFFEYQAEYNRKK